VGLCDYGKTNRFDLPAFTLVIRTALYWIENDLPPTSIPSIFVPLILRIPAFLEDHVAVIKVQCLLLLHTVGHWLPTIPVRLAPAFYDVLEAYCIEYEIPILLEKGGPYGLTVGEFLRDTATAQAFLIDGLAFERKQQAKGRGAAYKYLKNMVYRILIKMLDCAHIKHPEKLQHQDLPVVFALLSSTLEKKEFFPLAARTLHFHGLEVSVMRLVDTVNEHRHRSLGHVRHHLVSSIKALVEVEMGHSKNDNDVLSGGFFYLAGSFRQAVQAEVAFPYFAHNMVFAMSSMVLLVYADLLHFSYRSPPLT